MVLDALPVSRRIVKPPNCVLALGIPTTREGFRMAQQSDRADFAKRFLGGWAQYYAQFLVDLEAVEPILRKWGVTVVHQATLVAFASVLAQPLHAVILLSHCIAAAVQSPCASYSQE